jgi:hypothetical protein
MTIDESNYTMPFKCPICHKPVIKVRESDHHVKHNIKCENESYQHYAGEGGDRLIKFKHPNDPKD